MHPFCRCSDYPYVKDKAVGVRSARDENGKSIQVPDDMTYDEWHKKYVDESEKSGIIDLSTKNGIKVTKFSAHTLERVEERGVSVDQIREALTNPLHIDAVKYDNKQRQSQRFIGKNATVNINPKTGVVTTVWKTGKAKIDKYSKEGL